MKKVKVGFKLEITQSVNTALAAAYQFLAKENLIFKWTVTRVTSQKKETLIGFKNRHEVGGYRERRTFCVELKDNYGDLGEMIVVVQRVITYRDSEIGWLADEWQFIHLKFSDQDFLTEKRNWQKWSR